MKAIAFTAVKKERIIIHDMSKNPGGFRGNKLRKGAKGNLEKGAPKKSNDPPQSPSLSIYKGFGKGKREEGLVSVPLNENYEQGLNDA